MLRRFLLASLLIGMPLAVCAGDLVLAGSDLLRPALEPVLANGAEAAHPVTLRLEGSHPGMQDLRAGKADIAVLTFAPNEALPDTEFRVVPLAYQVVVLAVAAANPVRQVNYAQLGGLFGEKEPSNHRLWGDLGAEGVWKEKSVTLGAEESSDTLGLDLFRFTVLREPQLKSTITFYRSLDELVRRLCSDDTSIGLFCHVPADTMGMRLLLVSRDEKDVAFSPTPENIHTGDYPLRLPFFVVFKPQRAAELSTVVATLLSEEVAAELIKQGYVAVPSNVRREALRELGAK